MFVVFGSIPISIFSSSTVGSEFLHCFSILSVNLEESKVRTYLTRSSSVICRRVPKKIMTFWALFSVNTFRELDTAVVVELTLARIGFASFNWKATSNSASNPDLCSASSKSECEVVSFDQTEELKATGETFSQCSFLTTVVGRYLSLTDWTRGKAPGGGGGGGPEPGGGAKEKC